MSCELFAVKDNSKNSKKKKPLCCIKKLAPKSKETSQPLPPIRAAKCEPIVKPPKKEKIRDEPKCERSKFYQTPDEQRRYLEREVVPILMEGMLALARKQPVDPISYLEKFWSKEEHKCDIPIPDAAL